MGNTVFNHLFFEEIESTSSYLIKEHNNLENFTFVSSNYQSKGKGREDRQWISAKGANLLFSLLLKDKNLIKEYSSISLFFAAIVAEFLQSKGISGVQIKWPNDVYLNGKKIAGILLEGNIEEYLVIGVGININQKDFPNSLHHPATSIYLETGNSLDISKIKEELFSYIKEELKLENIQEKHYLNVVRTLDYLKGKHVKVTLNNSKSEVEVIGIDDDNSLMVKHNGLKINIISGEVEFI